MVMQDTLTRRGFVGSAVAGATGLALTGQSRLAQAAEESAASDAGSDGVTGGFNMDGFAQWCLDGGNAGNTAAPFFLEGEENKPTDEELERMLQVANTYFQCHFLTGTHFVVIRDTDEQAEILKFMGATGTGTVSVLVLADGLNKQDIHDEQYYPGAQNGEHPEYWNMPYAIFEAGWATAYLNLAAREMGYRAHAYGALNIPNAVTGEVMPYDTAGSFTYINEGMWDIEKYLQPKEGGEPFKHYCYALDREITCSGNLALVCVLTIGKIDEVDATTGATAEMSYKQNMRGNYSFWG